MNKEEYFERSKKEGVVPRCPYIGRCGRYVSTMWFLSGLSECGRQKTVEEDLMKEGFLDSADLQNPIPFRGADFWKRGTGDESYYFTNGCPEVPLFESGLYTFIPKKAINAGDWDRDRIAGRYGRDGKFKVHSTKHYTECAEYSSEKSLESTRPNSAFRNSREFEDSDSSKDGSDDARSKPPVKNLSFTEVRKIPAAPNGKGGSLIKGEATLHTVASDKNKPLSQREAAYLLAYNRDSIQDPRSNPNSTAQQKVFELCKLNSPTSGEQLYTKYDKVRTPENRKRVFWSEIENFRSGGKSNEKGIQTILNAVEKVIPLISDEYKAEAEKDLKDWNKAYSDEVR